MRRIRFSVMSCAIAALSASPPTFGADAAKDYPSRPIRMLVPNAPGSSVDTLSRIVGNKLSDVIGQQVVMDNRAGAGGIIGMEIAKSANPDGYTIIAATTAATTIARLLQKKPTFDPLKDYDYVVQFAETPNVLVVNPTLPIKSVKDLIEYSKAKKGTFNMASAGAGSQSHLSGSYFQQAAKIDSLHVPYKGGGASVASVIANESQWTLTPAAAVMAHVNAGRLRAVGHSLPKSTELLPNVPPIANTINDKLREAVVKTVKSPDVKKQLDIQATEIVIRGPAEFQKVVAASMKKNADVVKAVGLQAN